MAKKTEKTQKGPKNKATLVLLDAHAIIHRAYHALPEFFSSAGEPTGALYGLCSMLMKITTDLKPDYIAACYDLPGKTFRHEAYDKYKAGRMKADDALIAQLKSSRQIFEAFNIPIYDAVGFEADDVLGTIVEQLTKNPRQGGASINIIIASGDMDTMQLVDDKRVQIYTLKKGLNDVVMYDEDAVVARFGFKPEFLPDYKGLRGDPSDNIIGIKGIGEKTATNLIVNFGTIEEIYKKISAKGGPASGGKSYEKLAEEMGISLRILDLIKANEEEALFSKTLATIRRDAPVKFEIPKKDFWQNADPKKIEELFVRFEFRSLLGRMKSLFTNNGVEVTLAKVESTAKVDEVKLREASIALWMLDPDKINQNLEDILVFGKTNSFEDAYDIIFKVLKEKDLEKVYEEIEKPIMSVVKAMEEHGIMIDKSFFEKLSTEYHKELDKLTQKIYKMAGTEFNINSPKQLGEVLFEKMGLKTSHKRGASGSFSTKVSVLEELEEGNPIIREIMSYRELQKLLSTYIDVIPGLAGEDSRLHAKFLQNGAATGRFSSQDPNLQNLPVKTELGKRIRSGFVADKGHKLVAFDYSQIELRVAAILSGDKKMTQIFEDKKDIHAGVASFVFGVPIDKVDHEMRRQAKVINFGILYGMGVSALRKNLGGTREEAQKFYDNYFGQFSGVRDYLEEVKQFAVEHSYTETLFGRKRWFPSIKSRIPFLRSMAERTATNAPLQGTAADIIKLAIRFADEDLKKAGLLSLVHLVLQIHDELVYEIEESAIPQASKIIQNAMEGVLERSYIKHKTKVPILVNFGAGANFGEVK